MPSLDPLPRCGAVPDCLASAGPLSGLFRCLDRATGPNRLGSYRHDQKTVRDYAQNARAARMPCPAHRLFLCPSNRSGLSPRNERESARFSLIEHFLFTGKNLEQPTPESHPLKTTREGSRAHVLHCDSTTRVLLSVFGQECLSNQLPSSLLKATP